MEKLFTGYCRRGLLSALLMGAVLIMANLVLQILRPAHPAMFTIRVLSVSLAVGLVVGAIAFYSAWHQANRTAARPSSGPRRSFKEPTSEEERAQPPWLPGVSTEEAARRAKQDGEKRVD